MARRHLIARKSDGAFWCGMFGFRSERHEAVEFDSMQSAYCAIRDNGFPYAVDVMPAEWFPLPLMPL